MARQMTDVALDENEDLEILNHDFQAVESTVQHQRQLVLNNKGDFKQNATLCVGVFNYLDDEHYLQLMRAISVEFSRDGMVVRSVSLGDDMKIRSDAYYK